MQEIVIIGDDGKEHVFPSGFNPKRAAAIVRNGGSSSLPTKPVSAEDFTKPTERMQTAKDLGVGFAKGAGRSVAGIANMAAQSRMIPGLTPQSLPSAVVDRHTPQYANTAQRVGGSIEGVAEMAVPVSKVINAVPRITRAGRTLETVMSAAKDVPVNVGKVGDVAMRIGELGARGGTTPRAVTRLMTRLTDPDQSPLAYKEARDWASNISRLSADEFNRMTPVIQREMGNLRSTFNEALGQAAETVGHGKNYASGMKEYAQAAKLKSYRDALVEAFKRGAVPAAAAGGAGYLAGTKLRGLFGG